MILAAPFCFSVINKKDISFDSHANIKHDLSSFWSWNPLDLAQKCYEKALRALVRLIGLEEQLALNIQMIEMCIHLKYRIYAEIIAH